MWYSYSFPDASGSIEWNYDYHSNYDIYKSLDLNISFTDFVKLI